jgi:DNA-binding NtrC family response regulator
MNSTATLNILHADDDKDDCLFFKEALAELSIITSLITVNDGEQLMKHLMGVSENLPHVLFLDLNMPRKNGFECLVEIKKHALLKKLPVIIFSTSYDEQKANALYESGAYCYICKPPDFNELKKAIHSALLLVKENNSKPSKENFLITRLKTRSR